MRLPLVTALTLIAPVLGIALLVFGCAQVTSHSASTRLHVYDDPRLLVVSPAVRDEVKLEQTTVTAGYSVDVVSGATQALTVDAVSSATRFAEQRHQLSTSVTRAPEPELEWSASYALSLEPDHSVHAPSVGITRELSERMVRASAKYQLVAETIGRVDDPALSAWGLGHRVDLGWTQIVSTQLVLTALSTSIATVCAESLGCFANPYRYVGVALTEALWAALPERHPSERYTEALALRASWTPGGTTALHGGYRWFVDNWGITAHSLDTSVVTELAGGLLLRAEARATVQSAATFYRSRYRGSVQSAPDYRTADAELSALRNLALQVGAEWTLGRTRLVARLGRMWNHYPDYRALPTRHAWLLGLGVDMDISP